MDWLCLFGFAELGRKLRGPLGTAWSPVHRHYESFSYEQFTFRDAVPRRRNAHDPVGECSRDFMTVTRFPLARTRPIRTLRN